MSVVAVKSEVQPLAPGLADLALLANETRLGKKNRAFIFKLVSETDINLLMWQVTSLLRLDWDLSEDEHPYTVFLKAIADRKEPLPGALLRDLLRFEDDLLRSMVARRREADVRVLTQAALDDLRLIRTQSPSFALMKDQIPLWVFKVADDVHQSLGGDPSGYPLSSRLSNAASAPLQVRVRVSQRHTPPLRVNRLYDWAEMDEGQLLPEVLEVVRQNWPDLADLPGRMVLDVVATLPDTDPDWGEVPAVWQGQVDAVYAANKTGETS